MVISLGYFSDAGLGLSVVTRPSSQICRSRGGGASALGDFRVRVRVLRVGYYSSRQVSVVWIFGQLLGGSESYSAGISSSSLIFESHLVLRFGFRYI